MIMERQRSEKRKYKLIGSKKEKEEIFGELNTYI